MFRNRSRSSREFRSPERKLLDKRDRYRVYIRKATRNSLTTSKRRMLVEYMDTLNRELMEELLKADQLPLTPEMLRQWISELSMGKDDEFYLELEKNQIVGKLVCCLRKCQDADTKCQLVSFINNLVYRQARCVDYFKDAGTVDFCYAEIESYLGAGNDHHSYLLALVKLVRNLSAEMNGDFNLYLIDFNFCDKLSQLLLSSRYFSDDDLNRELLMTRTNLMLADPKPSPSFTAFEQRSLEVLNERKHNQHLMAPEYLNLLNAYVKGCKDTFDIDFTQHYPYIVETVSSYFKAPLPSYDDLISNTTTTPKNFYVKLLKLLKLLAEFDNNDLLLHMENSFDESPPKQFFAWALECPEPIISNYAVATMANYIGVYLRRFEPDTDHIGWLAQLIFSNFWQGKQAESSLKILQAILENSRNKRNWTDHLLGAGLLERIDEFIRNESTIQPDESICLLKIIEHLLEFGENAPGKGNSIARLVQSRNIGKWISANALSTRDAISEAAERLTEKYLLSCQSSQLQSQQ